MQTGTITISDIAARAKVSKSTVSRVLNNSSPVHEDKRKAVVDAMHALGYQPNAFARSLARGCSMTVGVLTQNIGSPFYDSITRGVIDALAGTEYSPIIVDGQWKQDAGIAGIRTLLGRRVDGLILIGGATPVDELNALRERLPVMLVARQLSAWEGQNVYTDNTAAGRAATQHLIEHGHRRIAIIRGIVDHLDAIHRYEGYRAALIDAGIEFDEDLVYQGDFHADSGVAAVNALLGRSIDFTAIFAANDMVAFGARLALHRRGLRVPEDISIVGFDDQAEAAFMTPPLTSVRQPAVEMGSTAARALMNMMQDKPFEIPQLPAELIVRESVAKR